MLPTVPPVRCITSYCLEAGPRTGTGEAKIPLSRAQAKLRTTGTRVSTSLHLPFHIAHYGSCPKLSPSCSLAPVLETSQSLVPFVRTATCGTWDYTYFTNEETGPEEEIICPRSISEPVVKIEMQVLPPSKPMLSSSGDLPPSQPPPPQTLQVRAVSIAAGSPSVIRGKGSDKRPSALSTQHSDGSHGLLYLDARKPSGVVTR